MGFKEGWNNVCNWGSDFCTWLISGRGVDYQFICKLYKEDFYGKNNDFQIFKPLNATTENNLKEKLTYLKVIELRKCFLQFACVTLVI